MSTPPSNQIPPANAMLDYGNHYKVILMIGPPGAGKERLIQKWVHHLDEQSVPSPLWISGAGETTGLLDFLNLLLIELTRWDQCFESLHEVMEPSHIDRPGYDLTDPGSSWDIHPRLENLLNQMLNRLMQFPEDRYIMILNYHDIRDPSIHSVISYLIDYLPPKIHLIISSQELPPLQIPRLRARRELLEIGPKDLKYASNNC